MLAVCLLYATPTINLLYLYLFYRIVSHEEQSVQGSVGVEYRMYLGQVTKMIHSL